MSLDYPSEVPIKMAAFPIMDTFERNLAEYEATISELEHRLVPVLEGDHPDSTMAPEEAPANDLHNTILRLGRLNSRLARICNRIKL